jgi:uncharacterized protein (DUF58 family)
MSRSPSTSSPSRGTGFRRGTATARPHHQLGHGNIYILPNKVGLLFLVMVFVVWLLGTNYQNNLILAVAYLMIGIMLVSIFHSYANLAGIRVKALGASAVFAGEPVPFHLELTRASTYASEQIRLNWENGDPLTRDLTAHTPEPITLLAPPAPRGRFSPGLLRIASNYPLGMITAWSWLRLDTEAIIYPEPIACPEPVPHLSANDKEDGGAHQGRGDDFAGLRRYEPGDSLKHIAWKQLALERGLLSKSLAWDSLTLPLEARLSGLCYWALMYDNAATLYDLRLPHVQLPSATGSSHLAHVLTHLALFDESPAPTKEKARDH